MQRGVCAWRVQCSVAGRAWRRGQHGAAQGRRGERAHPHTHTYAHAHVYVNARTRTCVSATRASTTPGTPSSAASTADEHAAHVIPNTCRHTTCRRARARACVGVQRAQCALKGTRTQRVICTRPPLRLRAAGARGRTRACACATRLWGRRVLRAVHGHEAAVKARVLHRLHQPVRLHRRLVEVDLRARACGTLHVRARVRVRAWFARAGACVCVHVRQGATVMCMLYACWRARTAMCSAVSVAPRGLITSALSASSATRACFTPGTALLGSGQAGARIGTSGSGTAQRAGNGRGTMRPAHLSAPSTELEHAAQVMPVTLSCMQVGKGVSSTHGRRGCTQRGRARSRSCCAASGTLTPHLCHRPWLHCQGHLLAAAAASGCGGVGGRDTLVLPAPKPAIPERHAGDWRCRVLGTRSEFDLARTGTELTVSRLRANGRIQLQSSAALASPTSSCHTVRGSPEPLPAQPRQPPQPQPRCTPTPLAPPPAPAPAQPPPGPAGCVGASPAAAWGLSTAPPAPANKTARRRDAWASRGHIPRRRIICTYS